MVEAEILDFLCLMFETYCTARKCRRKHWALLEGRHLGVLRTERTHQQSGGPGRGACWAQARMKCRTQRSRRHYAKITQALRRNYAIITQPLRNHYAAITQSLRSHHAIIITQPLRNHYAVITQSLRSHYAIPLRIITQFITQFL